jgi:hypothetical protein
VKFRASAWLICLLLAAFLLGGCSLLAQDPPSVLSITMTDQIKEGTMEPVRTLESFPTSAKLLYAVALVKSPRQGTKVDAEWSFDQEDSGAFKPVDGSSVTFPKAGKQNYVAFSLKAVTTFNPGTYKVTILLDGKPARDLTFKITQ